MINNMDLCIYYLVQVKKKKTHCTTTRFDLFSEFWLSCFYVIRFTGCESNPADVSLALFVGFNLICSGEAEIVNSVF